MSASRKGGLRIFSLIRVFRGDITYTERSTASGIIDLFAKDMHYESGVKRV